MPPGATADRTPAPKQPTIRLAPARGMTLRAALRTGIAVAVDTHGTGRITATAMLKRAKLGSAAAKVGASGKATVHIRFARKAARSLRAASRSA